MSVVCAAIKNQHVAIASDSQTGYGSLKVTARHQVDTSKLYYVNGAVIGLVGWQTMSNVFEHMIHAHKDLLKWDDRRVIQETLLAMQTVLTREYFVETSENSRQPVESNQLDGIIVNGHGIYQISSYRDVTQFKQYWAIGSGQELALGAMHAVMPSAKSALDIVHAGVEAAAEFDRSCALPVHTRVLPLQPATAEVSANVETA